MRRVGATRECSWCWRTSTESWAALARDGWKRHSVPRHEPILLCEACAALIAQRRDAARETRAG